MRRTFLPSRGSFPGVKGVRYRGRARLSRLEVSTSWTRLVCLLEPALAHPPDAAPHAAGHARFAKPGHPPDQEAVAAPVDAAVHDGVEPHRQKQYVLDGAKQEVAQLGKRAAQPAGLDGVAQDPDPGQDEEPA